MKKIILLVVMIFLIVITITGCKNNGNNMENNSIVSDQVKDYSNTFYSDDGSSIIIKRDGDKYKVNISLYRLSTFDGCSVSEIKDDILTISGIDPNENPIKFSFNWDTKTLTVIESTWDLLPETTRIEFKK